MLPALGILLCALSVHTASATYVVTLAHLDLLAQAQQHAEATTLTAAKLFTSSVRCLCSDSLFLAVLHLTTLTSGARSWLSAMWNYMRTTTF